VEGKNMNHASGEWDVERNRRYRQPVHAGMPERQRQPRQDDDPLAGRPWWAIRVVADNLVSEVARGPWVRL